MVNVNIQGAVSDLFLSSSDGMRTVLLELGREDPGSARMVGFFQGRGTDGEELIILISAMMRMYGFDEGDLYNEIIRQARQRIDDEDERVNSTVGTAEEVVFNAT